MDQAIEDTQLMRDMVQGSIAVLKQVEDRAVAVGWRCTANMKTGLCVYEFTHPDLDEPHYRYSSIKEGVTPQELVAQQQQRIDDLIRDEKERQSSAFSDSDTPVWPDAPLTVWEQFCELWPW